MLLPRLDRQGQTLLSLYKVLFRLFQPWSEQVTRIGVRIMGETVTIDKLLFEDMLRVMSQGDYAVRMHEQGDEEYFDRYSRIESRLLDSEHSELYLNTK